MANKANPARPVLVFHAAESDESRSIPRVVLAMIFSCLFNGMVIGLLYVVFSVFNVTAGEAVAENETAVIPTEVDENRDGPNLENDEVGLDPAVQTNYNVDRIEEVSVPGPVDVKEQVGIPGAPEGNPMTLPPPPGVGGNVGTGAGVDSTTNFGSGLMTGLAGGLGGKFSPGGFGGRSGSTRQKMLTEGGGNAASEAAVAAGLEFMAKHQAPDGHWSLSRFAEIQRCVCTGKASTDNDIAGTAFGLLPFLGGGQTHKAGSGSGNKWTKTVENGLKYLQLKQNREGEFHPNMYAQGLASIAMCEAYALTSDPALRGPAQRAVNYIVQAQSDMGGWRWRRLRLCGQRSRRRPPR